VRMAEQHLTTNGSQFSFKIKIDDKVFRNNHGAYDNLDTVRFCFCFVIVISHFVL
jgi:hypothetical protein